MAKKRFKRGQEVVIVANDDLNLMHGWETWHGVYIGSAKSKDRYLQTDHVVAIANAKEDVRLVEFFDSEVKHPWEVES